MHNGFEIAMLSLGRADSLLVTRWEEGLPTRVLVDGGRRRHADTVRTFLEAHEVARIDHVVCTHYDDDHAGGLGELIKDDSIQFGKAWVHVPAWHVDPERVGNALSQAEGSDKAQAAIKSLQTSDALLDAIEDRGLPYEEPFSGSRIAFMTVCGPSESFYEEFVGTFEDADNIRLSELRASANRDGLGMKSGHEMFHHSGSSPSYPTKGRAHARTPTIHHRTPLATALGLATRKGDRSPFGLPPSPHPR